MTDHSDVDFWLLRKTTQINHPVESLLFSRGFLEGFCLLDEAEYGVESAVSGFDNLEINLASILADYIASESTALSQSVVLVSVDSPLLLDILLTLVASSCRGQNRRDGTSILLWPHWPSSEVGPASNL